MNVIKKALSAFVAVAMLLSMAAFAVSAEDITESAEQSAAVARLSVDEADENGFFTATLSLHSIKFVAFQFGFHYNNETIAPVDKDGNPAEAFDDFATANTVDVNGAEKKINAIVKNFSQEDAYFGVVSYVMVEDGDRKVHVDEEGQILYEFRFKKIKDGTCDFKLAASDIVGTGKDALISDGDDQDFTMEFVYPETSQDENNSEYQEAKPLVVPGFDPTPPPAEDEPVDEATRLREERKAGTVVLQIDNYAVSVAGTLKWVDKDNKLVVPYIEKDRTMVPLRFISEAFGAEVTWAPETRTIGITLEDSVITMQIDNQSYTKDGEAKAMDVAPVIREDRTFVPLRFVSEALHKSVYWNSNLRVVIVAPEDKPWDENDAISKQLLTDTIWMFQWLRDEAYAHQQ